MSKANAPYTSNLKKQYSKIKDDVQREVFIKELFRKMAELETNLHKVREEKWTLLNEAAKTKEHSF